MTEPFDAFEYVEYLRLNWRVPLFACMIATFIALTASFLQPKRYTATATIIIDPPGTSDVRMSTAVSPMYLESLKTYEKFAASDSLFLQAAAKFHLQENGRVQSIESLKNRVLKVSKLRDTKILEISATLTEPKLSQSFVQYIAEQTIALTRDESSASDRDLTDSAQHQLQQAESRLKEARNKWDESGVAGEAIATLQSESEANTDLLARLRQSLAESKTDLAGLQAREPVSRLNGDKEAAPSAEFDRQQARAEVARVADLKGQIRDLQKAIAKSAAMLSSQTAHREELNTELKAAQTIYEVALSRMNDLRAGAGMRGERLRMIDPGIVPQRPSSPNISLNGLVALLFALTGSFIYLSLSFAYRQRSPARRRVPLSRAG